MRFMRWLAVLVLMLVVAVPAQAAGKVAHIFVGDMNQPWYKAALQALGKNADPYKAMKPLGGGVVYPQ